MNKREMIKQLALAIGDATSGNEASAAARTERVLATLDAAPEKGAPVYDECRAVDHESYPCPYCNPLPDPAPREVEKVCDVCNGHNPMFMVPCLVCSGTGQAPGRGEG